MPRDPKAAVRWFTLSAAQGNEYAQYVLAYMDEGPSILSCATRLLHHLSGIFQEQASRGPVRTVTLTDRKLRQRIREKKMAMGHKPDDQMCIRDRWPITPAMCGSPSSPCDGRTRRGSATMTQDNGRGFSPAMPWRWRRPRRYRGSSSGGTRRFTPRAITLTSTWSVTARTAGPAFLPEKGSPKSNLIWPSGSSIRSSTNSMSGRLLMEDQLGQIRFDLGDPFSDVSKRQVPLYP